MKQVPLLELRNHLGHIMDEVRIHGETIVVSRNGRSIARITPIQKAKQPTLLPQDPYAKWRKKLPPQWRNIHPSPKLLSLVGTGEYIPLEEEKERVYQYLATKHG